jgi:hypothetical protein
MNATRQTLIAIGWVLFGLGVVVAFLAFVSLDDAGGEWVAQAAPAASIGGPLLIAGAVLAAAGHVMRER